jgi:hypothetical protein
MRPVTLIKRMDKTVEDMLGELKHISGLSGLDVLILEKTEERAIREDWNKSKPHNTTYKIVKRRNVGITEIFPMYAPPEELLTVEIVEVGHDAHNIACIVKRQPQCSDYEKKLMGIADRYMRPYEASVKFKEAGK